MLIDERNSLSFDVAMTEPEYKIYDNLQSEITKIQTEIQSIDKDIAKGNKSLSDLDTADTCYACGQALDNTHAVQMKEKLWNDINDFTQHRNVAREKLFELKIQKNEIQSEIDVFLIEDNLSKSDAKEKTIEKDLTLWKEKLLTVITQKKLYKNPRLTLSDVAKELKTNQKVISSIVNTGFEMNFNDFINHHRIEAVKKMFEAGEQDNITLLGIAFDAGFNSKATFNRAFKKSTSLSPKEYVQKL